MWADKQKRADIFADTLEYFKENKFLTESINNSIKYTKYYSEDEHHDFIKTTKAGQITISGERTIESALRLMNENPGKKIACLNFASAVHPGGGVKWGASAQEECLCRVSTLFPILNTRELDTLYYAPNKKAKNNLHTDAIIYTPDIAICKTDTDFPSRINESEFKMVDIITCAAPNLSVKDSKKYSGDDPAQFKLSFEDQYTLHYKRCKHILEIAALNNIDILVLGAFGCGAFKNDPGAVSRAMLDACKEYKDQFDIINFAVVMKKRMNQNYKIFADTILGIKNENKNI